MRLVLALLLTLSVMALPQVALAQDLTPQGDVYAGVDTKEEGDSGTGDTGTGDTGTGDPGTRPVGDTVTTKAGVTSKSGGLPFTGLEIAVVLLGGAAMLGTGLAVRRASDSG